MGKARRQRRKRDREAAASQRSGLPPRSPYWGLTGTGPPEPELTYYDESCTFGPEMWSSLADKERRLLEWKCRRLLGQELELIHTDPRAARAILESIISDGSK